MCQIQDLQAKSRQYYMYEKNISEEIWMWPPVWFISDIKNWKNWGGEQMVYAKTLSFINHLKSENFEFKQKKLIIFVRTRDSCQMYLFKKLWQKFVVLVEIF